MNAEFKDKVDNYLSVMISDGGYSSIENLKFKLGQIFKSVDFKDKMILEIGGGFGMFSFYAAICGAKKAVNIEPEGAGSTSGVIGKFNLLKEKLFLNNIELIPSAFQDYNPLIQKFDVIILYNSVNHLDEKACIDLKTNASSRFTYKNIFKKISSLSNTHAKIIICDCSNRNFFPLLGLKNPFDINIEWYKHQTPEVWSELLKETGFYNPLISWTTFNRFRKPGELFLGNRMASFFLTSHFCLTMDKSD
jgi:SAM-dependent methyltransferase